MALTTNQKAILGMMVDAGLLRNELRVQVGNDDNFALERINAWKSTGLSQKTADLAEVQLIADRLTAEVAILTEEQDG